MAALALPALRVLSYGAMVDEGVSLVRATGATIRDAAGVILDESEPDEGSVETMFRIALITGINSRINTWAEADGLPEIDGRTGPGPRLTGLPGTPHHLRYQAALEHLNYEGADGIRRSLIEFTLADCTALAARMGSLSRGAALRAQAMKVACAYLRSDGKDRVGDLSAEHRDNIAQYLTRAQQAEDTK